MPVIIGVNFHPLHGSELNHLWGMVGSKHWWTRSRPNFCKVKKSVTDVSVMSSDMLVIAFHFNPLNINHLFSGPYGGFTLHVVYFYLLIDGRSTSQKTAMTSCSLLARSPNLHSLQTGYWSPVTITVLSAHWQAINSATRLIVACFVCILPRDVCQPKHKQTQ